MRANAFLFHLCVFVTTANFCASQSSPDPKFDSKIWAGSTNVREPVTISLNWSRKVQVGKVPERVTPKREVFWRVEAFNFIRYEPEVSVESKTVPGYTYLESLWAQVLSLSPLGTVGASGDELEILGAQSPFLAALESWRTNVTSAGNQLRDKVDKVTRSVVLSTADTIQIAEIVKATKLLGDAIEADRKEVESLILKQYAIAMRNRSDGYNNARKEVERLGAAAGVANKALSEAEQVLKDAKTDLQKKAAETDRDAKQKSAATVQMSLSDAKTSLQRFGEWATLTTSPIEESYYAKVLYESQLVSHNAVVAEQKEFMRRANECFKGRTKQLESQKAGTIVTLKARAKPLGDSSEERKQAEAAGTIIASYYVQSEMPLVFHAGLAYSSLKSFDYQVVQKNLSSDVYQQISKPDGAVDLPIYMTYLLASGNDNWTSAVGLTIGTGVTDPGKKLYLGATAKFTDHLLLTGGAFSQTVSDSTGRAILDNQKLFDGIKRVQKWGWFFSFSATPF